MSNTWIQEKPGLALAEDLKFNSTVGPPALKKFSEIARKSPETTNNLNQITCF